MTLHVPRFRFPALTLLLLGCLTAAAQSKNNATPDTLQLKDGNTLRGTLVSEASGAVTFHTPALGDVKVPWAKIKELHATEDFAVLPPKMRALGKKAAARLPIGPLDANSSSVTVHPTGQQPVPQPIPTQNASYIISRSTLNKELYTQPTFFQGWNGSATAGATLVSATQNQYTVSGSLGLMRTVPTVSWLTSRNRTSADFAGSFGKIPQPA